MNSAAIYLFAEQGYDNTSVEDVADAAGISVRTLFRYFTSKEDIVFARTFDLSDFLDGVLSQPQGLPSMMVIRNAYIQQLPFNDAERELSLMFHKAMSTTAALQGRFVGLQDEFRRQLALALAKREGRRTANETDTLTAIVAEAVLHRANDKWLAGQGRGNVKTLVEAAFRTFSQLVDENATILR